MNKIYSCSGDEFIKNSKIPVRVMETQDLMHREIASIMLDVIKKNNALNKKTTIICPVGPIGQYPYFAQMVNDERVSLKDVTFINMDEYVDEDGKLIDKESKLSFVKTMNDLLYSKIDPELVMPKSQRIFPEPGKEKQLDEFILSREIDCCLTGVGINGHIAFNEPPSIDEDITDEQFNHIGTRVLNVSRETVAVNGQVKVRGALDIFPKRCITLGMEQLLSAKVFKVYLYCDWQWGIMRKIGLGEVTRFAPASFLQKHANAEMVITKALKDASL